MQFLISLGFGVLVGIAYGFSGIKSPAPPIVALFGLLGIVIGERGVAHWKQRTTPSIVVQGADRADGKPQRPQQS